MDICPDFRAKAAQEPTTETKARARRKLKGKLTEAPQNTHEELLAGVFGRTSVTSNVEITHCFSSGAGHR